MASNLIEITLPDGSSRTYNNGITGIEIAESISSGLARVALSITVNGEQWDLNRPLFSDSVIAIHTWDSEEGKNTFWHSSAHILAEAVQNLYPNAKFGIGPPIETGFYYDIDFGDTQITQDDLVAIENKFLEVARTKSTFRRQNISKSDALTFYSEKSNEYKIDLIEGLEDGDITFYTQGTFTDLCRGPHIPTTAIVKAIKLTNLTLKNVYTAQRSIGIFLS